MTMVTIWKNVSGWANNNQGTLALLLFLITVFLGGLYYFIPWIYRQYILKHPFIFTESKEDYEYEGIHTPSKDAIRIWCINGEWYKGRINLHFKARRKIDLKQINLRFVEKDAKDAPPELISTKKIIFPQIKYSSSITWRDDDKGGKNGVFNPPLNLSRGNIIFIEVYPIINVPRKWKGYISLDNLSGDERRTFSRKKVIIKNELI